MKSIAALTMFILLLMGYSRPGTENGMNADYKEDPFFEIRYEDLLKNEKEALLSRVVSKVDYIQLETKENCLVSGFAEYSFCDSLIFIADRDHILKFSSTGKFLLSIGKPGRGPGEIGRISLMSVLPSKRLLIIHDEALRKMKYYSFDGKFIKEISVPRVHYVNVLNDGRFVAFDNGLIKSEKYTFRLTNEKGDTISVVKNYLPWANPSNQKIIFTIVNAFYPFYTYQGSCFFKTMYNDTVYTVRANKIEPAYFVNLGRYKLPKELRVESLSPDQTRDFRKKAANFVFANVLEAGGKIFLAAYSFSVAEKSFFVLNKNELTKNSLGGCVGGQSKIVNDWDGGMDFWPSGSVNNTQVFMPQDIVSLKKAIGLKKAAKNPPKYPENQKQLENIVNKTDVTANPIIMVVTVAAGM